MESFSYIARDIKTGEKIEAEVDAQNEASAARLLSERGLTPIEIKKKQAKSANFAFLQRIPTKEKVIFSRQLSTLINAGLPLVQSLSTVKEQTTNKNFQVIIGKLVNEVESGSSLADALTHYPDVFDDVYCSLIAAGEASGTMDKSLERLANQQEKDSELTSKVRGALVYPMIVIVVLIGVVTFMLTTVLPQVQTLYQGLPGARLPLVTRLLLDVSNFITSFWWVILLGFGLVGFLIFRYIKGSEGRMRFDQFKTHAPLIGPLLMKIYMARFSRTAATLVASGVPMIKMLSTAGRAVGNVHIEAAIIKAAEQVKGGRSLSDALAGDNNFLELVPNMIHIGEQSGSLEGMLSKLADYYEKEVDNQVKSISTIIEPVMMVIVGVIALVMVAAVLLPIYSLAGKNLVH